MTHITHLDPERNYVSYFCNREAAPHVPVESWKKVYGPDVEEMEKRYQADLEMIKEGLT